MADARDGGDHVAEALQRHGTRFLFTLCGGHISPILVGAKRRGIRIIDTRHEATAVFAADAVARLTGSPGVAAVTAGPGVTNTVTAVKNAQLAQSPLVLLGGAAPTVLRGRGALQDIDQLALMRPCVKWTASVSAVRDLGGVLDEAFARAASGVPGPVFVELPIDVLYGEHLVRTWYLAKRAKGLQGRATQAYLKFHLDRMFAPGAEGGAVQRVDTPLHTAGDVAQVAGMLARSERPLLLVGSPALLDAPRAAALAGAVARLGIPVYLSGMARGLLGPEHGLLLRHQRREALREADLVLLAGVPNDFRLDYGRDLKGDFVAVHRSRRDLTLNRRPTKAILGDPGAFLRDLAAHAAPGAWPPWLSRLRARDAERESDVAQRSDEAAGEGINPIALLRGLDEVIGPEAIIVGDGGDFVATASYTLRARGPLGWLDPGVFGTLGAGAGFALGAKLCRPDAEVWLLWGDGSSAYGLAEFDTFVRHGIPVIAVVGNDASWAQIARDQVDLLGDDVATTLARTDYDQVARGFGAAGARVETLKHAQAALVEAREVARRGQPFLLNAVLAKSDFRKGSISM